MPFRETPSRGKDDLTAFFEKNLKERIENCRSLVSRYVVKRSDDTFNITAQIIQDLYSADVVICDLSGYDANPNVMYELGVRLSVSDKPVILIRENHANNRPIFDISGFYIYDYNPHRYAELEEHIIEKLRRFGYYEETFKSPVLGVLEHTPQVVQLITRRYATLVLDGMLLGLDALAGAIGMAMHRFLRDSDRDIVQGVDASVQPPSLFLERLDKRNAQVQMLDWQFFRFHPATPPGFAAYLQAPPLGDLLPAPVPEAYDAMLLEYYRRYLVADHMWNRPQYETLRAFLDDTFALRDCTAELRNALAIRYFEDVLFAVRHFPLMASETTLISDEMRGKLVVAFE
jgi:hypothetical protein